MGDPAGHSEPPSGPAPARLSTGAAPVDRLADQLNTLSEVVETLTFRLLELEEQVAAQQQRFAPLLETSLRDIERHAALRLVRFDQTEHRLSQLEQLLHGAQAPGVDGPLPASAPSLMAIDGPFPEELEQPFMDDVPA